MGPRGRMDGFTKPLGSSTPTSRDQPTLLAVATASPLHASVFTAVAALSIHPWSGKPLSQPISFELRGGNPIAYLTLLGLASVVLVLGARFWRDRHFLSAAACGLCLALLAVIPATDPRALAHNAAFLGLMATATLLFLVWALDTFDFVQVLPPLAPVAFGLAFRAALGIGGFQLLLIGSLLVALNLTHRHLVTRWDR